jgi:hypothetical protein
MSADTPQRWIDKAPVFINNYNNAALVGHLAWIDSLAITAQRALRRMRMSNMTRLERIQHIAVLLETLDDIRKVSDAIADCVEGDNKV